MFGKLAALILAIGVTGCVLLTVRQQRLQAVNELAVIQKRVAEHDRTLWHLRIEVASRVTPAMIERMAQELGPLAPTPIARMVALEEARQRALSEEAERGGAPGDSETPGGGTRSGNRAGDRR